MYIVLRKHINMEPGDICFEANVVLKQSRIINSFFS